MVLAHSSDNPWASVDDLQARWRPLTEAERGRALALIDDAAALIQDECPNWARASEGSLRRVICAVVRRAMQSPSGDVDAVGVSQTSMTAGPYTQSFSFSNPGGDLYLTKAERRNINGQRGAFEINLLGGADDCRNDCHCSNPNCCQR